MIGSKMNQAHYNLKKKKKRQICRQEWYNSADIFNTFPFNCGFLYQSFHNVQYKHLEMFAIMYGA